MVLHCPRRYQGTVSNAGGCRVGFYHIHQAVHRKRGGGRNNNGNGDPYLEEVVIDAPCWMQA